MPVIEIERKRDTAFVLGFAGWPASAEEREGWQRLVACSVEYAFALRPVALLTLAPAQWSIGMSLPGAHTRAQGRDRYLVNYVAGCSTELLADVAESEDFRRGLLWIAALSPADEDELITTAGRFDPSSSEPPQAVFEVLLLLDDARRLYWHHPSRDTNALDQELTRIAGDLGWEVSTSG